MKNFVKISNESMTTVKGGGAVQLPKYGALMQTIDDFQKTKSVAVLPQFGQLMKVIDVPTIKG